MASVFPSCSEENLSCPICLEVLNCPVSTPCGHNFCRTCIETSWSGQYSYKCPLCNKVFEIRPDLQVNFLITDLADHFRSRLQVNEQHCAKPGDVPCDVCNGTKLKAVKSCLACLISYCHTHLEPHQRVPGLKRHQLVDPMDRLEDRICKKHSQLLELFCHTEQLFVCQSCIVMDHKFHPVVPIREEYEEKMKLLWKIHFEVEQMIQGREQQIHEIHSGIYVTENQAESLIVELVEEITLLTSECSEMMQVSQTEDPLHFLQAFRIPENLLHFRDWTTVEVCPQPDVRTVSRAQVQLEEMLNVRTENPRDLKAALDKYARELTLDPNTTHRDLTLSDGNRKVMWTGKYPDHPERFDTWPQVLGREGLTGRCYWEVEWEGRVVIGVTYRGITRRGMVDGTRLGANNKSWSLYCSDGRYLAWYNGTETALPLRPAGSTRVGVYLDRPAGSLSFYRVSPGGGGSSDTLTHLHTFCSSFTQEDLLPGFHLKPDSLVSLCRL
ncbi:E3 ubiquitin/ISG15 ligase TRIM25-like isoform X3 [Gadus chalcogrammus]|nr:E3 ubiquitin/ISG15 ligase TRIM25-like isoform X3 [Gadus chalcogrammus]